MTTWTDVKNYINQKLPDSGINVISPLKERQAMFAIIDQIVASAADPIEYEWKAKDDQDNSVIYEIGDPVIDDNRWFIAIQQNTNKKPVLPDGSINTDYWQEENASNTRYIEKWEPKLFTYPVEIVLRNKKQYLLDRDVVGTGPFLSEDIDAEIAADKWIMLGGGGGKFTELSDTPNSFAGLGGLAIKVKNDETGLEAGAVQGVPDGTFTIYSSADVTLNPTKAINNNFRLNRSADGLLEFDLTNVDEGNSGSIITFWSSTTAELLIEQDSIIKISSDSFNWFRGLSASRVSVSNVDGTGTGGRVKITTSAAHGLTTGDIAFIQDVGGTEEANGANKITVIDSTNFELDDIVFLNSYTSGGEASYATKSISLGFSNNTYSLFSFIIEDGNVYLTGVNEFI